MKSEHTPPRFLFCKNSRVTMPNDTHPFLRWHTVAFRVALVHELPTHGLENGFQQRPPKHEGRLKMWQRVAEGRYVTENQPSADGVKGYITMAGGQGFQYVLIKCIASIFS